LRRIIAIAIVVGFWALGAGQALAAARVALVIGNSAYQHAPSLPNPPRDADAMAAVLRQVGFSTVEVRRDQGKAAIEAALKQFAQEARGAEVAVVYYAGHSLEQGGVNYLVPVDATLATDADVEYETVPLRLLERSVEGASRLKLIILDACRNNPFAAGMKRTSATRAIGRGLARVEPEGDTLIAYAAREGAVASDGDVGNSPYTASLVRRLATPGLEVRILFGQVRDDVLQATARAQEPAIYGSLGGDPFYFVPPPAGATTTVASAPMTVDPKAVELAFWQSASAGNDAVQLQVYLTRYPDGAFAELAKAKIAALSARPTPAAQPALFRNARATPGAGLPILGLMVRPIDESARAELKLPASLSGLLVEAVPPQSDAASKGLRPGDIITEVGGEKVATPGELQAAAARALATRSMVMIGIYRDGATAFLAIRPPLAPVARAKTGPQPPMRRPPRP